MADDRQPIDWYRVVIHGLFGLIVGGLGGLFALFRMGFVLFFPDWGILVILLPALGLGLAGACWGDAVWERMSEWWSDHGHWF